MTIVRTVALLLLTTGVASLLEPYAFAQTTCFGNSKVMTCLGQAATPPYQVNCFGPKKYQVCISQDTQFSQSGTPSSANSPTNSPTFQSPSSKSSKPASAASATTPPPSQNYAITGAGALSSPSALSPR
jgi:hypothetical protein